MKLPKSVRPEEFVKLIKKTKNKEIKLAFLLAYGAGLRISEVKSLRKEQVLQDRIQVLDGKGGKDRVVPKPKGFKGWMLTKLPVKKSIRTLQRSFTEIAKKASLNPDYTFHSLRHGFATRLVENGVPLNQVQLLLGHANLATTSVYTRAAPTDALKNYEELF